jgi:hypothetical protein
MGLLDSILGNFNSGDGGGYLPGSMIANAPRSGYLPPSGGLPDDQVPPPADPYGNPVGGLAPGGLAPGGLAPGGLAPGVPLPRPGHAAQAVECMGLVIGTWLQARRCLLDDNAMHTTFICPDTGAALDFDLPADEADLPELWTRLLVIRCPFCRALHRTDYKRVYIEATMSEFSCVPADIREGSIH